MYSSQTQNAPFLCGTFFWGQTFGTLPLKLPIYKYF